MTERVQCGGRRSSGCSTSLPNGYSAVSTPVRVTSAGEPGTAGWRYRAHQPRGSAVLPGTAPQDGARPEGATTEHDQAAAEQRHRLHGVPVVASAGSAAAGVPAVVGAAAAAVVVVGAAEATPPPGTPGAGAPRGERAVTVRATCAWVPAAACRGVVVMPKASAASGV